ncbi:hypothetical protein EJ110_NYTH55308 [Nymphaea thermarum]|nr:hypothetical protein EJ110_NYTH55308 [Nymphaea thermarum]
MKRRSTYTQKQGSMGRNGRGCDEGDEQANLDMYSFQRGVTFPYDHILFGEGPELSTYISFESKPLAPEWYRTWHPTFSRMFPSYFEKCGLETVAAGGMQSVDGNLVHAIAERWNPRTSSLWFPWEEMTILLDEFAEILDLPTPTCDPNDLLEKQFLMNPTKVNANDLIAHFTGRKTWPLVENHENQSINMKNLYEEFGTYVEPSTLPRKAIGRIKHCMMLCTVGVTLFTDGSDLLDVRIAQLFRVWGHRGTRHLSVAMTALAFPYRGLTRFTIGDTDFIEGCTYALQLWFLKHAGPRASLFRNTDGSLTTLEQYRRLIEQLNEGEITWDYCDRRQSLPRYTHHHHGRTTLLGPYFIVDYCGDRCMRQFSQRQKMVSVHAPIGAIPEFDLSSPQWTALFAVARQEWKTQISYTWFIGPVVKKEYAESWDANRPPSILP